MDTNNTNNTNNTSTSTGSVVTFEVFLQYLTHFLRISIYINMGTEDYKMLERMIALHNKFKKIESECTEADEKYVRLCLKRLNLVLKVDSHNKPLDLSDKSNQLSDVCLKLKPHPSIPNNKIDRMISYASNNKINILTSIPLTFILRTSPQQEMLWQYVRLLFYISQMIISNPDGDESNELKNKVYDDSLVSMASLIEKIDQLEAELQTDRSMCRNEFLNNRLLKTEIKTEGVGVALEDIKGMFARRGLSSNPTMMKLLDKIFSQIPKINSEDGNLLENVKDIAESVARDLMPELEKNPEDIQEIINTLPSIVTDLLNHESLAQAENLPPELRGALEMMKNMLGGEMIQTDGGNDQIIHALEDFAMSNGINPDNFFDAIMTPEGHINQERLQAAMNDAIMSKNENPN